MSTVLRADAQRNLVRVLDAAREVFAEQGIDAPVVEIAERAGVGVGTIFRRFPTKDDLVVAVVEQRTMHLIEAADSALDEPDPEAALFTFMEIAAAMQISDRCWCDATGTDVFARAGIRDLVDVLVAKMDALLARAQASGHVRADLAALDLPILLTGVAKAGLLLEAAVPGAWRRHLAIVFDGLRPDAAHPLPRPALTAAEFEIARASSNA